MADIGASNVTHSVTKKHLICESQYRRVVGSVAFGNGVLTYPAGGIPLTKGKLGLPVHVESLSIFDDSSADGFVYKVDHANLKIRIYQGDNNNAADAPLIELVSGVATPAATTLKVEAWGW